MLHLVGFLELLDLIEGLIREDVDDGLLVRAEALDRVAEGGDVRGVVGLLDDAFGMLLGERAEDALEVAADGPLAAHVGDEIVAVQA